MGFDPLKRQKYYAPHQNILVVTARVISLFTSSLSASANRSGDSEISENVLTGSISWKGPKPFKKYVGSEVAV